MTVNAMQTIDQIESQLWEAADQLRAELRTASGDLFGRIYEYFLMKFAMQGAQDNGVFSPLHHWCRPSLMSSNQITASSLTRPAVPAACLCSPATL